jgi:DNA excision repair protein ERCC-4
MNPDAPRGSQGRKMMLRKLRSYLWWKGKMSEEKRNEKGLGEIVKASGDRNQQGHDGGEGLSEAMKKKDKEKAERLASRRRVRGGAPPSIASGSGRTPHDELVFGVIETREAETLAKL